LRGRNNGNPVQETDALKEEKGLISPQKLERKERKTKNKGSAWTEPPEAYAPRRQHAKEKKGM